jgi:hypothetical protein
MNDQMELGFFFHPADDEFKLGHPKLEVNVYSEPTEEHFDPDQLLVPVTGPDGNFEVIKITHPWRGFQNYKVAIGHIIICDRYEKKIDAFIFGGNLKISNWDTNTHCLISSTAPIIPLINETSAEMLFVSEFESLLAKLRTNYDSDIDLERKLMDTDPLIFFTAGLVSVRERLEELLAVLHDENYRDTYQIVINTIQLFKNKGKWPSIVPTLEILLESQENHIL